MHSKTAAINRLVNEKFPLLTSEISRAVYLFSKGPPNTTPEVVLKIIQKYPDHFYNLIRSKSNNHQLGSSVWVYPNNGYNLRDVDVDIVCRYLKFAFKYTDYLHFNLPHEYFLSKYESFLARDKKRLEDEAKQQDAERFFSFPDARATRECWLEWIRRPYLTSDQCAALALSKNPEIVSLAKVEASVGQGQSRFLTQYKNKKDLFECYQGKNDSRLASKQFLKIVRDSDIEIRFPIGHVEPDEASSNEVSLPAINSLYRIVLALAMQNYPDIIEYLEDLPIPGSRKSGGTVMTRMEKDLRSFIPTINDGNLKTYLGRAFAYAKNAKLLEREEQRKIPLK